MGKLWAVALVVLGCRGLVGCDGAVASDGEGPDTEQIDGDLSVAEPGCDEGAHRCNGRNFELCLAGQWLVQANCGSAPLCAEFGCVAAACAISQARCAGATYQRCTADGDGWESVEECASAERCDAAIGCLPDDCPERAPDGGITLVRRGCPLTIEYQIK